MNTHILVVEDNLDNSKLVSWILEDEGYDVTCVESGERCLALLEKHDYDLILLDISLPGMNGKDVTRRIRQQPHLQQLPVVALTAHAIETEQQSILNSGVDELLTKPLNDDLLIATIRKFLPP